MRLLRGVGDSRSHVIALVGMSTAALAEGKLAEASACLEQACALVDAQAMPGILLPFVLYWRGIVAMQANDLGAARAALERAVSVARAISHRRAVAHPLYVLANVEIREGRHAEAAKHLRESLRLHDRLGDGWGVCLALAGCVALAVSDDPARAARLLGGAEAIRSGIGVQIPPFARREHDELMARIESALTPKRFGALWREGAAMARADLVRYAIGPSDRDGRVAAEGPESTHVAAAPAGELRIVTLGSFEVLRNGAGDDRAWGSARARELLAFLVTHPDGCSRERIGAALWPEASSAQVRNNFHVTLHRIRRALDDPECIVVRRDRYLVNPAYRVEFDAGRFAADARALIGRVRDGTSTPTSGAAALEAYRGDFLEHERVGEWHLAMRDELRQLYETLLQAVADAFAGAGRAGDSIEYYARLLARDCTSEPAARGLMRAYTSVGDRVAARRVYEQLVLALREELGASPEPETIALARQLASAEPVRRGRFVSIPVSIP